MSEYLKVKEPFLTTITTIIKKLKYKKKATLSNKKFKKKKTN